VQRLFISAARDALGEFARSAAASAASFGSIGVALCAETVERVKQLRGEPKAEKLATTAALLASRGRHLVALFEKRDDKEALDLGKDLMFISFSAFRLTADVIKSRGPGLELTTKFTVFLRCNSTADAFEMIEAELRSCIIGVLLYAATSNEVVDTENHAAPPLNDAAKVLLDTPHVGEEAARFWSKFGFDFTVNVDDLLSALHTWAAAMKLVEPDSGDADLVRNTKLRTFFTQGCEYPTASVQRFRSFVLGKRDMADALAKYTQADRASAPSSDPATLRQTTLDPVGFGRDLIDLQADYVPGTRGWVFAAVEAWMALLGGDVHHRAFWLQGPAGLGKSAIAAQLVVRYGGESGGELPKGNKLLAAHFFCKHDDEARNSPHRMLATLAFRLAAQVPAVAAVWDGMLADEGTRAELGRHVSGKEEGGSLEDVFEALVAKPLRQALEAEGKGGGSDRDLFILIDALDELQAGAHRAALLKLLGEKLPTLPPQVRVLVTSRPEEDIVTALASLRSLVLAQDDAQQRADLAKYFEVRVVAKTGLAGVDMGEQAKAVEAMQTAADGVFLAAKLLGVELLRVDKDGGEGLLWDAAAVAECVSGQQGLSLVYATYAKELKRIDARLVRVAEGDADALDVLRGALRRTLEVLLAAARPLTLTELAALSGGSRLGKRQLLSALTLLFPAREAGAGVQPLHKSVFDFLRRGEEVKEGGDGFAAVDEVAGHVTLAKACTALVREDGGDGVARAYAEAHEITHVACCAVAAAADKDGHAGAATVSEAWLAAREAADDAGGITKVADKIRDGYGLYRVSIEWGKRAAALRPDDADVQVSLGIAMLRQAQNEEALELLQKALETYQRTSGIQSKQAARAYHYIGVVFSYQGRYAEALEHYAKALAIRRDVLGERHPDTAATFNNMGSVFKNQGRHTEALEYYAKALAIKRDVLGERHPDTASTYNNMADVFDDQGRHAEALEYYAKALATRRDVLGERHPDTAMTYNNMAVVFMNQGRHVEALEYYAKSLAIARDVLGDRHPDIGNTYYNMATVHKKLGDLSRARELYGKAHTAFLASYGADHKKTVDAAKQAAK
jgi:tetratricopeptide (TPR) repeat protein